MAKILIVNNYWPPTGGPCVQRWVDFSRHLAEQGHSIKVVAPVDSGYPVQDKSLENRVHKNIELVTVGKKSLITGTRKLVGENWFTYFVRGNFFLPDPRKYWNKYAIEYLEDQVDNYDILITAGPPHSTHFVGYKFRKRIKWIADFHDFWTDAIYIEKFHRTFIAKFVDRYLEKKILDACDLAFVHCEDAKLMLQQRTETPLEVIRMGYFESFFEGEKPEVIKGRVCHIGTLLNSYTDGIAFMGHLASSGFKVAQIGPVDPDIALHPKVELIPPVEHKLAIKSMQESEYLILINHKNFLPGKIYEYLGANRPILLVSPSGTEAEKIIEESRELTSDDIYKKYSRKSIAEKVEQIINKVISNG